MTLTRTHTWSKSYGWGKRLGYLHHCVPHPGDNSGTKDKWYLFRKDDRGWWYLTVASTPTQLVNGLAAGYGDWKTLQDALDWYNKNIGLGRNCKLVKYRSQR